jgi:UbiD family decarboxylase
MGFRDFIEKLESDGEIIKVEGEVSKHLEMAGILKKLDGKPVLFTNVKESEFGVAGNVFSTKKLVAQYFGCRPGELIRKMLEAIEKPEEPEVVETAPCQEVVEEEADVNKLPVLFHTEKDGGNYIASGVFIVRDEELGQNASFHRMMQIGKNKFAVRILPRHLNEYLKKNGGEIDAAVCIGNGANFLLASAISIGLGESELKIANSLEPLKLVKAKTADVLVPAESEFVLEGRITKEAHSEGPFVDLTGTYDIVREQPVFEVRKVSHRRNPIYHALIPGGLEHKVLMGTPREPTIFREVNKVCRCMDVSINPGGCSWLHAIVQVDKGSEDDGRKAVEAAFKGHKSLKHCFVVDKDINIYDPLEVEWAMATRFQGDRNLVIKKGEKGSSLDPSSNLETRETAKMGFDMTKPLKEANKFEKAKFLDVDIKKFVDIEEKD